MILIFVQPENTLVYLKIETYIAPAQAQRFQIEHEC
jgi:hypothetical protein